MKVLIIKIAQTTPNIKYSIFFKTKDLLFQLKIILRLQHTFPKKFVLHNPYKITSFSVSKRHLKSDRDDKEFLSPRPAR